MFRRYRCVAEDYQPDPPTDLYLPAQFDPNSTNQGHIYYVAGRLRPIFNGRSDPYCGYSISCLRSYEKSNARGPGGGPSTGIGRFGYTESPETAF